MAAKPKGATGPGKAARRATAELGPGFPPPGGPDAAASLSDPVVADAGTPSVEASGDAETMQSESAEPAKSGFPEAAMAPSGAAPKSNPRDALIGALMELAGERVWEDITLSDIATRANLSLADFRDAFPSKGAVLAGFSRKIDRIVLDGTGDDLAGEPAKERLFDVLMRRLDALAPYKLALESITEWLGRAPLAAAAVNRLELNSMRFMLEAAGIDAEGPVGAVKLQGLVIAWGRVLQVWLRDDDPALSKTMNALDKELTRGARIVGRADDINRLVSPLIALTKAMFERRPDYPRETSRPMDEPAAY